ncbi:hypothetical protein CPB83DRAFT_840656 [Crepidotus variabilis]|uniref:Uncharacterized protein n=1 Tax=Crepidotus variabilis TaxID=179855 RepID=A0A9P6E436_9AGAR|nr:hypothetical protein CPB83DRAFT_840656 [Crepidotus variabilis]
MTISPSDGFLVFDAPPRFIHDKQTFEDFDASWCAVCQKLIPPTCYHEVTPLPPSHKTSSLISGSGFTKAAVRRLVIHNQPTPLYCLPACYLADFDLTDDASTVPFRDEHTSAFNSSKNNLDVSLSSTSPLPRNYSCSTSSSTLEASYMPLSSGELIKLPIRYFSNTGSSSSYPAKPPHTHPRQEHRLVAPGTQGTLLVPNVKLKTRGRNNGNPSSKQFAIESSSQQAKPRLPSTLTRSSIESEKSEDDKVSLFFTLRKPTFKTRPWCYTSVSTYHIMPMPLPAPTKRIITCTVKQTVDGDEIEVQVEEVVEEEAKPKCLFLFAPTTRLIS